MTGCWGPRPEALSACVKDDLVDVGGGVGQGELGPAGDHLESRRGGEAVAVVDAGVRAGSGAGGLSPEMDNWDSPGFGVCCFRS